MTTDKTSQNELYSYSFDKEHFHGDCVSRERAIADGIADLGERIAPGMPIFTGRQGPTPHARVFLPSVEDLLDGMRDRAFDDYDEFAESWLDSVTHQQKVELQTCLETLAEKIQSFDRPAFYLIDDIQTYVVPGASA